MEDFFQQRAGLVDAFRDLVGQFSGVIHARNIFVHAVLNVLDSLTHFMGRGHGLFRQLAHIVRHHGKSFACISGPGRFNGGIQGQQVGLIRDIGDYG